MYCPFLGLYPFVFCPILLQYVASFLGNPYSIIELAWHSLSCSYQAQGMH